MDAQPAVSSGPRYCFSEEVLLAAEATQAFEEWLRPGGVDREYAHRYFSRMLGFSAGSVRIGQTPNRLLPVMGGEGLEPQPSDP